MPLDIAPFAVKRETASPGCFRFIWEEPRNVARIVLGFSPDSKVALDRIRISYLNHRWPGVRPENMGLGAAGSGWRPIDDWFNGRRLNADTRAMKSGNSIQIVFAPLAEVEFPNEKDFNVTFRRTLALDIALPEGCPEPERISIFTDTEVVEREALALFGCDRPSGSRWDGHVEVYNGALTELKPLDGNSVTQIAGPDSWKCALKDCPDGLRIRLLASRPNQPASNDNTIVTLRTAKESFSFSMDDLVAEGSILIPDLDVQIKLPGGEPREIVRPIGFAGSVYDRVIQREEQTWPKAWAAMPPKLPLPFALGCKNRRQKFRLQPNGDIECPGNFIRRVAGPDTGCVNAGWELALRFGLDGHVRRGRFIEEDCLPIVHAVFGEGAAEIEQTALATPLRRSMLDKPGDSSEPVIAMLRFRFSNDSDSPISTGLTIRTDTEAEDRKRAADALVIRGDAILCKRDSGEWLRFIFDTAGKGTLTETNGGIRYNVEIPPGKSHDVTLKLPYITLESDADISALREKDFTREAKEVREFWIKRVNAGAQIEIPEPIMRNFFRAQTTHIMIADDEEMGCGSIFTRVGCFHYGNFSNESCMIISALDRRGWHDEAQHRLEAFIRYQGTVPLPGDFSDHDGVFYGSGGYENGDYNQHHGWVLWCMGEHWRLTRDREWIAHAAPAIIKGCDWVIRQRSRTKKTDPTGRRALEYGFLPAGALEDVQDFSFWLSTNTFTWWGLNSAATALCDAGHPDGPRLTAEADAYAADLRAGFKEAMTRSPVVKLRDGTWVPHQPSRLYLRGRDFGWLRETLEGAIHMIPTRLLPADGREATWILKDFEDNRYLSERFGYSFPDFERWWFDRGGFSMQPNLHWFCEPYLMRDQPEHFLRAFFNGLASALRQDTAMLVEHPLPELHEVWGDHFKTSDEAQATHWMRLMFVQESGNDLYIGRGIPRYWMRDGRRAAMSDVVTYFGPMSIVYQSMTDSGRIRAELKPPLRNPPERVIVRFRHPDKSPLKRVTVGGVECAGLDPSKEWVALPAPTRAIILEAEYE
ncbi:MAG TPA: hypothetical protein PL033_02310 [Candidatus Brocadiia bacterium]|nr:hypothetical protein [Candidatus Brocadiia bacterium]